VDQRAVCAPYEGVTLVLMATLPHRDIIQLLKPEVLPSNVYKFNTASQI
jgi:hypothetical protein